MNVRRVSAFGSAVSLATAACLVFLASHGSAGANPELPYAPGEVLIGFRPDAALAERHEALNLAAARGAKVLGPKVELDAGAPGVLRAATQLPVERAVRILQNHPAVAFAEPNYRVAHTAVSNDPFYTNGSLWGVYGSDTPTAAGPTGTTNAFGSNAEAAWSAGHTGDQEVYIGLIDEGVQVTHPDLAGNMWTNPFDPVDGVDNDLNGYADDASGWDFFSGDNSVYDGTGDDHGTHCAGTIGGQGGNGAGVAGVNWDVTIIPCKFLGPNGGYISDAVEALNYLVDLKRRHGLRIVAASNSWGGGGYSSSMHAAIVGAANEGILFVAAAGNSGSSNDSNPFYPASYSTIVAAGYESVLSVASITSSGARSSFSNYGATTVDLGAPGSGIVSTVPTDSYASYSGTSMACPHVSGAAALYASAHPDALVQEIREAILSTATPTASLSGITATGGRLNAGALLGTGAPPPPAAVHDVAVTGISAPGNTKRNRTVNVSVVVANQGTELETFSISLTTSLGTPSASQPVTLSAGESRTVTFTWNAGPTAGTATLTAAASAVTGETDAGDNTRSATSRVR